MAMTQERIITGLKITDGSTDDGKQLPDLVEQSKQNGIVVTEVIGDTAYSREDNLNYANDENNGFVLVSKLHPCVAEAHTKERDGFTFNKDADTYVCSAGHILFQKKSTKRSLLFKRRLPSRKVRSIGTK